MMLSGVGETITQITPLPPVYADGSTVITDHPINIGSDLGSQVTVLSQPASNPFAGLSTATGLSGTTLLLIAGGAILFFAMKK